MVARRIVVCLDVAGGRVVKGTQFEDLRAVGDPVAMAQRYERLGADEIVLLQIDGFRGRPIAPGVVRSVAHSLSIPLTVGGGIESVAQVESLLAAGSDRVSINSAALRHPGILNRVAQ
ncbi:MAG: HisA/HisF-related TIM barrel protein, partial [Thermoplasmata archaeon]|nr:HisA/HisF-related TIM barrel protein [Thermoplasmata archaeon]